MASVNASLPPRMEESRRKRGLVEMPQFDKNFCHTAVYFLDVASSTEGTTFRNISHVMCGSSALACAFCLCINQEFANHQHSGQTAANGRWSWAGQTCTCKFSQLRAAAPLLAMTSLPGLPQARSEVFGCSPCLSVPK